jgi:hypothetical protein
MWENNSVYGLADRQAGLRLSLITPLLVKTGGCSAPRGVIGRLLA